MLTRDRINKILTGFLAIILAAALLAGIMPVSAEEIYSQPDAAEETSELVETGLKYYVESAEIGGDTYVDPAETRFESGQINVAAEYYDDPAETRFESGQISAEELNSELYSDNSSGNYQTGTVLLNSSYSRGTTLIDSYMYSDDWFFDDPAERNDILALASMQVTAAVRSESADDYGCTFLKEQLGFSETGVTIIDMEDFYSSNYTWGKKTISKDGKSYNLVLIAIQSLAFDDEEQKNPWRQDFTVNGESTEGEHHAFSTSAEKILDDVAAFSASGNTKYWIVGHSRGGAVANLLAAKLPQKIGASNSGIYTYTFESPATVEAKDTAELESFSADYSYIHNYISSNDFVTKVPFWGMTRYGVEHKLNTEETDAQLTAELNKLGSSAVEVSIPGDTESREKNIIAYLEEKIPSRADYSEVKTDTFTDSSGNELQINYVYQDVFIKLVETIIDVGMGKFTADELKKYAVKLLPSATSLIKGIRNDSYADYWDAANEAQPVILSIDDSIQFTVEELYVLLKLAGPLIIDPNYSPDLSDILNPARIVEGYFKPGIELLEYMLPFIHSHHFDVVAARLHVLAKAACDKEQAQNTVTPAKVVKAANPIRIKVRSKTYKRKQLTSRKTFKIGVTKAKGKVTYTLGKSAKKAGIKVGKKGKVTIPKKCRKGTYKIKVKAKGNAKYKAGTKTVTIKVK